jgi:hypothetical protein
MYIGKALRAFLCTLMSRGYVFTLPVRSGWISMVITLEGEGSASFVMLEAETPMNIGSAKPSVLPLLDTCGSQSLMLTRSQCALIGKYLLNPSGYPSGLVCGLSDSPTVSYATDLSHQLRSD